MADEKQPKDPAGLIQQALNLVIASTEQQLQARIREIDQSVAQIKKAAEEAETKYTERLTKLEEIGHQHAKNFTAITRKLQQIDQKFVEVQRDINSILQSLKGIKDAIDPITNGE